MSYSPDDDIASQDSAFYADDGGGYYEQQAEQAQAAYLQYPGGISFEVTQQVPQNYTGGYQGRNYDPNYRARGRGGRGIGRGRARHAGPSGTAPQHAPDQRTPEQLLASAQRRVNDAGGSLRASFDRTRSIDVALSDASTALSEYMEAAREIGLAEAAVLSMEDPTPVMASIRDLRIRVLAHCGESSGRRAVLFVHKDLYREAGLAYDKSIESITESQYYADERLAESLAATENGRTTNGDQFGSELGIAIGILLSQAQDLRQLLAHKHTRLMAQLQPMLAARDAARAAIGEERWSTPRDSTRPPSRHVLERREVQSKVREIEKLQDKIEMTEPELRTASMSWGSR